MEGYLFLKDYNDAAFCRDSDRLNNLRTEMAHHHFQYQELYYGEEY
jgi:hypothetical protein